MTIWTSSKAFTKIKVTKADSNILSESSIEKKFFKLFFKRCIGGRFIYLSIQRVVKLWTLKENATPPGIGSLSKQVDILTFQGLSSLKIGSVWASYLGLLTILSARFSKITILLR